jgi:hypothetical protein
MENMAKKSNTVEKAIYFGVLDWMNKHKEPVNVLNSEPVTIPLCFS